MGALLPKVPYVHIYRCDIGFITDQSADGKAVIHTNSLPYAADFQKRINGTRYGSLEAKTWAFLVQIQLCPTTPDYAVESPVSSKTGIYRIPSTNLPIGVRVTGIIFGDFDDDFERYKTKWHYAGVVCRSEIAQEKSIAVAEKKKRLEEAICHYLENRKKMPLVLRARCFFERRVVQAWLLTKGDGVCRGKAPGPLRCLSAHLSGIQH